MQTVTGIVGVGAAILVTVVAVANPRNPVAILKSLNRHRHRGSRGRYPRNCPRSGPSYNIVDSHWVALKKRGGSRGAAPSFANKMIQPTFSHCKHGNNMMPASLLHAWMALAGGLGGTQPHTFAKNMIRTTFPSLPTSLFRA